MINYNAGKIDIAVVGAGHAGIEAALAAARLGCNTILFTLNLDAVANMPCIVHRRHGQRSARTRTRRAGRTDGQIRRRGLPQSRMLNLGKGPRCAVCVCKATARAIRP
jgi:tRNA uridine 5-carboxymethylaminomethyl modification enzyme